MTILVWQSYVAFGECYYSVLCWTPESKDNQFVTTNIEQTEVEWIYA